MSNIIKFGDQDCLVSTKDFQFAKFLFDEFNPVQSRVIEFFDQPSNALIAAQTSAGKTVCAEMYISHEVRQRGGKGVFLAPLKALAQEKIDDWMSEDHHFADLNKSICTGDYQLTASRKKELEQADVVIMTSEMLNSRARNHKSENNQWLQNVGTLVVDESHLLTVPGRGDKLEAGIMKFIELNPAGRIVFLSATMPNVSEIAEWLSHITNRPTNVLLSKYRPCPLRTWYKKYDDRGSYDEVEREKIWTAMQIVIDYQSDKFLIFVHSKTTGRMMRESLLSNGVDCVFHNADLDSAKRIKFERQFKEDKSMRVIIATPTLAQGLNLPARRVIVLGIHRGMSLVEGYNITQMIGRAGRPKFDKCGDAYILIPNRDADNHVKRLSTPEPIMSQMCDMRILAFHIVSEVSQGNIKTKKDISKWYSKTLAAFQAKGLDEDIVDNLIMSLKACHAIYEDAGKFKITPIGRVASLFYYSPYDIFDLKNNFDILFDEDHKESDLWISMALGNINNNKSMIVNKAEREDMNKYTFRVLKSNLKHCMAKGPNKTFSEGAIKAGYCYSCLMTGKNNISTSSTQRQLQFDFPRLSEVLNALDGMVANWDKKDYFKKLSSRITYGVPWEMVDIVGLPDIGKVRANKLWDHGLRTLKDISENPQAVAVALNYKEDKVKKLCEDAKRLL